ncbi:MAG: hypothetical protein HY047_14525 [Acidobacteria bacterium]|nr:hypothetical protein [Acidobacteriota bacterium]
MSDDEKPRDRKIAVIAVHGVGDQKPFDTVRAIGDLLQDLDVGAPAPDPEKPSPPCVEPGPVDPAYYPFREQTIRINVRPVVVPPGEDKLSVSGMRGPFHAFVNDEWRRQSPPAPSDEGESDDERLSERFMRGQLRCYRGEHPEDTYETIRLEGARAPQGGAAARDLHIYELYWADLSRLKAGLLSIFTELYQLLFHLSSLGTHAVDAEALRHRTSTWQWFRRAQSSAAVVLTVPIPIIHLLMLGVTAVVAGLNAFDRLGWPSTLVALTAIVAAGCVAAIGRWMWSRDVPLAIWLAPVGIWLATVGVAAWFALTHTATSTELLRLAASGVFIVVVTGLLALVLLAYDRRRPGTVWWGLALPPVLVLVGVASCVIKPPQTTDPLVFVWVRVFETLYGALLLSWPAFFLLGAASFAAGQLAVGGVRAGVGADLARRSRWTGMLMLALPALVLLITTLAGWGVLATGLIRWGVGRAGGFRVRSLRGRNVRTARDRVDRAGGADAVSPLAVSARRRERRGIHGPVCGKRATAKTGARLSIGARHPA